MGEVKRRRNKAKEKRRENEMSERAVNITMPEKRVAIYERRQEEKHNLTKQRQALQQALAQVDLDLVRVQGRQDSLVEATAEDEGYDWSKVDHYVWDDETKRFLVVFTPEDDIQPDAQANGAASNGAIPELPKEEELKEEKKEAGHAH